MRAWITGVVAVSLAAAACGGGAPDDSATPTSSSLQVVTTSTSTPATTSPTTSTTSTTTTSTTTSTTTTVAVAPGEAWTSPAAPPPGADDVTDFESRGGSTLGPAPRLGWLGDDLLWVRPKQFDGPPHADLLYRLDVAAERWEPVVSWSDLGFESPATFRAGLAIGADAFIGVTLVTDHPDPFRRELRLFRVDRDGASARLDVQVPSPDTYRYSDVWLAALGDTVVAVSPGEWVTTDQERFGTPTDPLFVTCVAGECRTFVSTIDRDGPGFFWVHDVAIGEVGLVAVGRGSTDGGNGAMALVSSDNGASWEPVVLAASDGPISSAAVVAFGEAGFVALGALGADVGGWRSGDGITWEAFEPAGLSRQPDDGAGFVWAMGEYWLLDANELHASADGITWRQVEIPDVADFWARQVAIAGRLAVAGDEGVSLSPP